MLSSPQDEQFRREIREWLAVNLTRSRAALRQLVAPGHGCAVVNNASVLGWRAQPGQAHYAAAKAGVMALTRCTGEVIAVSSQHP